MKMNITRTSPVTGKENTMYIDVCREQMDSWMNGMLIQKAMPNISADEREFIMTGSTPEDWDTMFGEEE
jgi:hypothetical protein